ncbi:lysosome membrane protein 2 [Drosophila grimshawi]|uniref:GH19840 n=1 Tax=Drosophila grimshawi TaxID=7222 RepID=B4J9L7_DROGR|nr:lysosome membrane protein 2 [Drosophila grimshawi]XP_032590724.1 lysosome membrane protein 2 [Drosophila grimshawi]XP_032590725.1 lysosome membrane protein 2 [Drosophila grimshawi]XP_032590726.1 lysosome membrane protein 2 [Drosophila grimshawi]EDW02524.1 GH19840 [Drosophila grimshawi]
MSQATSDVVAQLRQQKHRPVPEDFTVQNKSKSNTLSSQRNGNVGGDYIGGGGGGGGGGYSNNSPEKLTVLDMILDSMGLRNLTSKDIGALILLGFMFLLFVISVTGFFVMWFTEYYNNTMLKQLILAEDSETAKSWLQPDTKFDTLLKAHIFNYTNIEDVLAGRADKIDVVDLGPLTYQEHTVKDQVSFNKNHTVTFRDKKSYIFLPDKSTLREDDVIMVPNVPLLSAAVHEKKLPPYAVIGARTLINFVFREPLFKRLTVHEYLWGYEDNIVSLKSFGRVGDKHFGLLRSRNGTSVDLVQLNTGEDDISKYSIITQFNGMPQLDFWQDDECNRIDGSDPSMFSPTVLQNRSTVQVFLQVLCRKVPLNFEKEATIYNNIDVLRYRTPLDVFAHPSEKPANECYCRNTDLCLPGGVINATRCYGDLPIFPSFPHFFSGDKVLYENFTGINPDAELHQTYADIHPRFGFPVNGASRVQINIMLDNTGLLRMKAKHLKNNAILPLIWIEITAGDFNKDVLDTLHFSTFGLDAIQVVLKYGTLLISVTTFSLIVASVYYLNNRRDEQQLEHSKSSAELEALAGPSIFNGSILVVQVLPQSVLSHAPHRDEL